MGKRSGHDTARNTVYHHISYPHFGLLCPNRRHFDRGWCRRNLFERYGWHRSTYFLGTVNQDDKRQTSRNYPRISRSYGSRTVDGIDVGGSQKRYWYLGCGYRTPILGKGTPWCYLCSEYVENCWIRCSRNQYGRLYEGTCLDTGVHRRLVGIFHQSSKQDYEFIVVGLWLTRRNDGKHDGRLSWHS